MVSADGAMNYNRICLAITSKLLFLQSFLCGSSDAFFFTNMMPSNSIETTVRRTFPPQTNSPMFRNNCFTLHASINTNKKDNSKLSDLPIGISPFEKSLSKSIDVQADFRSRAKVAVATAVSDGIPLIEIEFPPLIGGQQVSVSRPKCGEKEGNEGP